MEDSIGFVTVDRAAGRGHGRAERDARTLAVPDLTTTTLTLMITGIAADTSIAGGTGAKAPAA